MAQKQTNGQTMDRLWDCIEDMLGYANYLERIGCRDSGEGLREIIGKLEHLCDLMYDHPTK